MFVLYFFFLALSPMIFPNPGMQRVFIHPEVAGGLGNRLIRLDGEFHRPLLKCSGIFFRRGLAHRTHLICCMMSVSPCVRESITTSGCVSLSSEVSSPASSP